MKKPLFSIIVPVYNVERYIKKCIDSIMLQTYRDFEIILVDDGSTDSSRNICDEYSQKDERIHVIHKTNGGLGSARVAGVRAAQGEYISFVDSDDWIDTSMYEKAYDAVRKHPCIDIIIEGYVIEKNNKQICPFVQTEELIMEKNIARRQMFAAANYDWSLCDKLYKKDLFTDNLLTCWPQSYGEDTYANWILFGQARRILYIPVYAYHYYMHRDSMTHQNLLKAKFDYFKVYDFVIKQINPLDKELYEHVLNTALNVCLPILYKAEKKYDLYSEEIKVGIKQVNDYYNILKNICDNKGNIFVDDLFTKVNQDKKLLEEQFGKQSKEIIEFASGEAVYVYGAGDIAEEILCELENLNVKVKNIVVSKIENYGLTYYGIKIIEINELVNCISKVKIITAMNHRNTKEVEKTIGNSRNIELFDAGRYSIYYYS